MSKYKNYFFKRIDILRIPPLFTIRGRTTFQSQIGRYLILVCIILILIYLLVFLNQLINHKKHPDLESKFIMKKSFQNYLKKIIFYFYLVYK